MKRFLLTSVLMLGLCMMYATEPMGEITFEKTTHDFGKFSEKDGGVVTCIFKFKNTGDAPLVINQVVPSCGCTTPTFTETPVEPGKTGEIKVTYNGKGRPVGPFNKLIQVRTNGKTRLAKIYIKGEMTK